MKFKNTKRPLEQAECSHPMFLHHEEEKKVILITDIEKTPQIRDENFYLS